MRKYFVTGLVILLPLALTIAIATFVVNFLTTPFVGFVKELLTHLGLPNKGFLFLGPNQVLHFGSQFLILILLFAFTLILGAFARWFFFHSILKMSDYVIHRIPFINKIYKLFQDVVQTIFVDQSESFKQVVIVPFPTREAKSIGLVTRRAPKAVKNAVEEPLVAVFVPTTPNPTSGFLCMYKAKDLIYVDMSVEDGIKFIISCGVIHPETTAEELEEMMAKGEEAGV